MGDSLRIFMDIDQWSLVLYSVRSFHTVPGAKALCDVVRSMPEKELCVASWRVSSVALFVNFQTFFNRFTSGVSVVRPPDMVSTFEVAKEEKRFGCFLIMLLRSLSTRLVLSGK